MPRLIVVCDSNIYRGLGTAAFDSLTTLEANQSVIAFASYFVVTELLAHIADQSDPAYDAAWAALRRLWRHCKHYDGSRELLRLIGDSEAQVPRTLFGKAPAGRDEQAEEYGYLVGRLVAEGGPTWTEGKRSLANLRKHVLDAEDAFVKDLFDRVVKGLEPTAATWEDVRRANVRRVVLQKIANRDDRPLIAQNIAEKAAQELGLSLSPSELRSAALRVQATFVLPVEFYSNLLLWIVRDGVDMSSYPRPNSLWDYQITFSTGVGARLWDRPVVLISDDRRMLDAAKQCGSAANVRSLQSYWTLLQLPTQALESEIAK